MRIRQFTHGDLDGAACAAIAAHVFPKAGHVVTPCFHGAGSDSIDVCLGNFLDAVSQGVAEADVLLITDICPSPEVCEVIERLKGNFQRVLLQDHHETCGWVSKYAWAESGIPNTRCGAKMLYDTLECNGDTLREFVAAVDAYDRWELEAPERLRGERLNLLFKFLGFQAFLRHFLQQFDLDVSGWMARLIPYLQHRVEAAVEAAIEEVAAQTCVRIDERERRYAFLVVNEHASEIGHAVLESFPNIDYVVMALPRIDTVTMRSRPKSEVNVADIARANGGGGHAPAAGFSYPLKSILWNAVSGALE